MSNKTIKFDSIVQKNRYLERTMGDYFIPKMRYTYTYTSPTTYLNPIRWETTIEEASNFISLIDMACGRSFNEKEKKLFKNPYAQFVRLETDFTKTWSLGTQSCLVGHINAGIMFNYGNSNEAPFSEEFYVGGANSIRAFAIREIGPGSFSPSSSGGIFKDDRQTAYLMRNGDLKFVANLEYRTPLFGNLKGAVFLDMGNVWRLRKLDFGDISEYQQSFGEDGTYIYNKLDEQNELMKFHFSNIFDEFALGTGVGLRYDLGFLVVRLDWGIALHTPYDTGKSGYFNIQRFKDANTLHFAIGYPF